MAPRSLLACTTSMQTNCSRKQQAMDRVIHFPTLCIRSFPLIAFLWSMAASSLGEQGENETTPRLSYAEESGDFTSRAMASKRLHYFSPETRRPLSPALFLSTYIFIYTHTLTTHTHTHTYTLSSFSFSPCALLQMHWAIAEWDYIATHEDELVRPLPASPSSSSPSSSSSSTLLRNPPATKRPTIKHQQNKHH
jgi:hypothetical protein